MSRRISSPTVSYNAWSVSVFLMLFWGFHYTVLEILGIKPIGILCIELFGVGTVLIMTGKRAIKYFTPMLGWVFFFLLTLWNNYYIVNNALSRPVAMLLVVVLAYSLQFSNQWYKSYRQCITVFALEHFALSWVFFLAQGFYENVIIPLFPADKTTRLLGYRSQNILIGFTDHFSISGIFFAFGCIAAFIYWLQDKKSALKTVFLVLMIASLIMTQKRGPLVFSACAIFAIYFIYEKVSMRSIALFFGGLVTLFVSYFIVAAFYPPIGTVFERFINGGNSGRSDLYEIAREFFMQAPVFGSGFGQFREYSLNYYSTEYSAHHMYLQLLAELGIVGALFFVVLAAVTLATTAFLTFKLKKDDDKEKQFALMFSLGCQIYFLTYAVTGNPIYDPQCYLPYFISLAVPYSVMMVERSSKGKLDLSLVNEML